MRKIVITGPESTGKSTLAASLARHYNSYFTEEQARKYLNGLDRTYEYEDLETIAAIQIDMENVFNTEKNELLFCDTDLLTIKIWSLYKYHKVATTISEWINHREYDLYLLCRPDLPWEADPLRENPYNREELFDKHLDELNHYQKDFEIVEGFGADRLEMAIHHVDKYLRYWE